MFPCPPATFVLETTDRLAGVAVTVTAISFINTWVQWTDMGWVSWESSMKGDEQVQQNCLLCKDFAMNS